MATGKHISVSGVAAAGLHLALLCNTVAQILSAHDTQWPRYWVKFLALDFPFSMGVIPLAWIFPAAPGGPLSDFANFWWPLGYHSVIGTVWWYFVGMYIGGKVLRHRTRDHRCF